MQKFHGGPRLGLELAKATIHGRLLDYGDKGIRMKAQELVYPSGRRIKVNKVVWAPFSQIKHIIESSQRG